MRKLLSLILVAAMVLGLVGTAFAATFPDVTNETQVAAVDELNALGVLTGDNGQFRPNDPITRAEFAAVVVRMLGLDSAAKLINTPPSFKDVTAASAWAYGYINIASTKNIVKGDPAGTFRPTANVTFAEAVTMLVRAAGWDAEASKIVWPAGYIMKATEYGLTDDVVFDANKAATRGDVAIMADAALSMNLASYDPDTQIWSDSTDTILSKYLKSTYETRIVTATPATMATLKANQLVTTDGTMYVPAGVDPNAFLGREVSVIKKNSTTYSYIADATDASQIITAYVKTAYAKDDTTITVYDDDNVNSTYGMVGAIPTVKVVRNNVVQSNAANAYKADDDVTLFLDDNSNVRFVIAEAYDNKDAVVSAKVTKGVDGATANTFTTRNGSGTNQTWTVLANTVITKNDKPATFADLAKGDIAYVKATGTSAYAIDLYSTKVTGTISAISFSSSGSAILTVGGTNYTVSGNAYAADCTIDGGASIGTIAPIGTLMGYSVDMTINQAGRARIIKATSNANIGRLTATTAATDTKFTASIKGVNTTFTIAAGYTMPVITAGKVVEIKATADGQVYSLADVSGKVAEYTIVAVDTTNKLLTIKDGSSPAVVSVVSYATNLFGNRNGTWGDVTALQKDDVISLYVDVTTAKYYETSSTGVVGAKFVGQVTVGTTKTAYFQVQNEIRSYQNVIAPAADLALTAGDFALVTLNAQGQIDAAADVVKVAAWDTATGNAAATSFTIDSITGSYVVGHYHKDATPLVETPVIFNLSKASQFIYDSVADAVSGTTISGLRTGDSFKVGTAAGDATGTILVVYVSR